jgi:hypothetical protein
MKLNYDDFVVVIVSYFSYGWTQQCLNSLFQYSPDCKVLAVDNNPSASDDVFRKQSFTHAQRSREYSVTRNKLYVKYDKFCDLESEWLNSHSNITAIKTPFNMNHGEAIDLAIDYCFQTKIKKILLIEPDCRILGCDWMHSLLWPLDNGLWMTSGNSVHKSLHPCPSAWIVDQAKKISFKPVEKAGDIDDNFFDNYFKFKSLKCKINFLSRYSYWDTGMKIWYEFQKQNRAKLVLIKDFVHYFGKSSRPDYRIMML